MFKNVNDKQKREIFNRLRTTHQNKRREDHKRKYKFDANNVEVMIIGTCKKHAKYRINNGK